MLMGYKRPDYLAKIGRIRSNGEVIDMLEDAIEQQTPYISDYSNNKEDLLYASALLPVVKHL